MNKCPHTDFTIHRSERLNCGVDYSINFCMIGQHILYSQPHGHLDGCNIPLLYEKRQNFLKDFFKEEPILVVEVRDYSDTTGSPTRLQRTQQRDFLLEAHKEIIGVIICNASFVVRNVFRIGCYLTPPPFVFFLMNDLESSLKKAIDTIHDAKLFNTDMRSGIVTNPQWEFDAGDCRVRYEIIHRKILHTHGQGLLKGEYIPEIIKGYEKLISSNVLDDKWWRMTNYTDANSGSWKDRLTLSKELTKVHLKYNKKSVKSNVYGASNRLQVAIRMIQQFLDFDVSFYNSLTSAMIAFEKNFIVSNLDTTTIEEISVFSENEEVGKIIKHLGAITWDQQGINSIEISEDSTFLPVYDAINLVKEDVDYLIAERDQRKIELESEILKRKSTEKKLEIAKERAEQSSRVKGQFLANMSHEVRTPLNAIIGLNQFLRETELDSQQIGYLDMVEKAGNSLLGIIDDILDFSKLESGRIILNEMPFDLMDVTDEIINLFSVQTAKKNLHYCVIVNHRVPRILEGDAGRLRQLLINLISNSIKFTAKGSVIIELDFLKSENQLQIQVKDTGIGISADFFSEMYNPFSQEDSSDTRKYGGTGLGLAICKEIVTLMKGQIFCESTENLGTTFKISLPVKPMEIGKLDFKKVEKKIILTGDNQKNLKMMHQFLLRLNCDFTIVDLSDIYDMKIENEIIFCVLSMEETKRMSKDNFARCSHSDEIIFFTPFELLQRKNRLLTPENIILQPFPIGFRKLETICL